MMCYYTCPETKSCWCWSLERAKSKGEKEPPQMVMICGASVKKEGSGGVCCDSASGGAPSFPEYKSTESGIS